MSDARADALLKSALEKIVYFEARSEQVQNDLAAARADAERFKNELAAAAQREIGLRRQIAELEVTVGRGHREREELARINDALRAERTGWMDKLLDSARIQATGVDTDGLDLASFIATLRAEVIEGRRPAPPLPPPPVPLYISQRDLPQPAVAPGAPAEAPPDRLQVEAERYFRQGRLAASEEQVLALAQPRGATERTLFGFSVRELSNPDAGSRIRAAERLKALGDRAAAPALATALHSEQDAKVLVALVHAFASLATQEGAELVAPLLTGSDPEVRIAALKALLALDPERAAPHLSAASRDPDPWVRRRASLLALGRPGEEAIKLSETSAHDGDAQVRRLSTLTLGAAGQDRARAQLLEALGDPAPAVRTAAASSLGRMLGQDVRYVLGLDPVQRRREIRKLSALPAPPVRRSHPATAFVSGDRSATGVVTGNHLVTGVVPGNGMTCGSGLPTATADASNFVTVNQGHTVNRGRETAPTGRGVTGPGHSAQGVAGPGHSGQVVTGPGHSGQVVAGPGHSGQVVAGPGHSGQVVTGPGHSAQVVTGRGHLAQVATVQGHSARLIPGPLHSAQVPARPVLPDPSAPPVLSEALAQTVISELRSAIRGRTQAELSAAGAGDATTVQSALSALIARGQVVQRGSKFFVA